MAASRQLQDLVLQWRQRIQELYPERHKCVYTLPFVHFRKVPFVLSKIAGEPVLVVGGTDVTGLPPCQTTKGGKKVPSTKVSRSLNVPSQIWSPVAPDVKPKPVGASDLKDDAAQQLVLNRLKEFGTMHGEVMFVISQLEFTDYLNKPCYAAAVSQLRYPRPQDLGALHRRGEFDVLLVHRRHGLLVGEIKSVGSNAMFLDKPQQELAADVAKKVGRAVKQLDRSKRVLRHLLSDLAPGLAVKTTLILPYVTRADLKRVLERNQQLCENLARCLDATSPGGSKTAKLCLCADDLAARDSGPWQTSQMEDWWRRRIVGKEGTTEDMSEELYDDILARFAGPATTVAVHCTQRPRVEIRTLGDAVSELGDRLAKLVITPEQVCLLTSGAPRVLISGPPGTGKSLVLVLMALAWLRRGKDVHVVSLKPGSLAISKLMHHQLQMTLATDDPTSRTRGTPHMLEYDIFRNPACVGDCVSSLSSAAVDDDLRVIVDEYGTTAGAFAHLFDDMAKELLARVPDLHLWAASNGSTDFSDVFQLKTLTVPLRCAPSVIQEVNKGLEATVGVRRYSTHAVPTPFDGPEVIRLHHSPSHLARWPLDCELCGDNIAAVLIKLGVGMSGPGLSCCRSCSIDEGSCVAQRCACVSPPILQYRDVFVLANSTHVHDDIMDETGKVTSRACGVIRGLRAAGIPTSAVRGGEYGYAARRMELEDVAVAKSNAVIVADRVDVGGLERKVVVWLSGRKEIFDEGKSSKQLLIRGQLFGMSRCISQLVVVEVSKLK